MNTKTKIGFIGQGFVGSNTADDFETRGFSVVRYALESEFEGNRDEIASCDVVFIAVPTPTTPQGFSADAVKDVIPFVGIGKVAVIKSTVLPGTTEEIQELYPDRIVIHSPEFLSERSAAHDSSHPDRLIVGIPKDTEAHRKAARDIIDVSPPSPYTLICTSKEAEIIKYFRNIHGFVEVVLTNIFYDLTLGEGASWEVIKAAAEADPYRPKAYLTPLDNGGRGAGGHCFIKDFAAFKSHVMDVIPDERTEDLLDALEKKNIDLLRSTGKSGEILESVYGSEKEKMKTFRA